MTSIPYLFIDTEEVIPTENWYNYLIDQPGVYRNCFVRRITHIKNVGSVVSHECLQIIVQDESSGARTRLIARQIEGDQVIIGHWQSFRSSLRFFSSDVSCDSGFGSISSCSSSSSSSRPDLPLPMFSLTFDPPHKLNVCELACILHYISKLTQKSIFYNANSFWYALTVYETARLWRKASQIPWRWSSVRGCVLLWKRKSKVRFNLTPFPTT